MGSLCGPKQGTCPLYATTQHPSPTSRTSHHASTAKYFSRFFFTPPPFVFGVFLKDWDSSVEVFTLILISLSFSSRVRLLLCVCCVLCVVYTRCPILFESCALVPYGGTQRARKVRHIALPGDGHSWGAPFLRGGDSAGLFRRLLLPGRGGGSGRTAVGGVPAP